MILIYNLRFVALHIPFHRIQIHILSFDHKNGFTMQFTHLTHIPVSQLYVLQLVNARTVDVLCEINVCTQAMKLDMQHEETPHLMAKPVLLS